MDDAKKTCLNPFFFRSVLPQPPSHVPQQIHRFDRWLPTYMVPARGTYLAWHPTPFLSFPLSLVDHPFQGTNPS